MFVTLAFHVLEHVPFVKNDAVELQRLQKHPIVGTAASCVPAHTSAQMKGETGRGG
jgi:hypothetical protein